MKLNKLKQLIKEQIQKLNEQEEVPYEVLASYDNLIYSVKLYDCSNTNSPWCLEHHINNWNSAALVFPGGLPDDYNEFLDCAFVVAPDGTPITGENYSDYSDGSPNIGLYQDEIIRWGSNGYQILTGISGIYCDPNTAPTITRVNGPGIAYNPDVEFSCGYCPSSPNYEPEYQPFCCDINAVNFGQMASGESYGMNPGEAEQYLMINGSQGDMCNNSICQGNVNPEPEDPCRDFTSYVMDNFGMPEDAFCAKCESGSIIDEGCDCCRPPEEESQGYNCRSGHMGGTSICVPCGPSGPCEFPNKNACLKSGCEKTSNYLEPLHKKRLQKLANIPDKKRG